MKRFQILYGIIFCVLIAFLAKFLNHYLKIGSVTLAILLGILLSNLIKLPSLLKSGIAFSEKKLLNAAIMLLGVKLNFIVLQKLGLKSMLMIVTAIAFTFFMAFLARHLFNLPKKLSLLLGFGNAVCGSSAIAGAAPILEADEDSIGLSVTVVNFLGALGIFLLPVLASFFFDKEPLRSSALIGNTLQAVGQVSAAGFSMNAAIGQTALIVKMGRILMLGPLLIIFTLLKGFSSTSNSSTSSSAKKTTYVPLFVVGFVFFSLLVSFNLLPLKVITFLAALSKELLIIAMAGIGLKISFKSIGKSGLKVLIAAAFIFICQIVYSLGFIKLFF